MTHWLTDLADVARAAGLNVVEYEGWRARGRRNGSGFADGRPTHVMIHHTASQATAEVDCYVMTEALSYAPIANLYVARNGDVWVLAAGPTNTNGSGSDWWSGGVPDNSMNSYAVGIEVGNAGTGEPYPEAQQNATMALTRALLAAYEIRPNNVRGHFEWSPGRKIDPLGPSRWTDGEVARWDMPSFRKEAALQPPSGGPTDPEGEDPEMMILDLNPGTDWWVAMVLDASSLSHLKNGHHVVVLERGGTARVTVDETELEGVLLSVETLNASPFAAGTPSHNAVLDARWRNAARS